MTGVLAEWWHPLLWVFAGAAFGMAAALFAVGTGPRGRAASQTVAVNLQSDRSAAFAAALDNLPQEVILFDDARRVMFCNRCFREIYDLPTDLAIPGTPVSELIQHRLKLGLKVTSEPDDYVRERSNITVGPSASVHEFQDDRIIAYTLSPISF